MRKAVGQHQLGSGLDLLGRIAAAAAGVGHGESQRGFGDEVDGVTDVGADAGGRLAALLGTHAGGDELANAAPAQPQIQPGVGEGVVRVFVEAHRGCAGQPGQGFDKTGRQCERPALADVKDVHHRHPAFPAARLQAQQGALERRQIILRPERHLGKRLLHIDDDEGRFRCFQRLSLPDLATRQYHWRDNRYTRGSALQLRSSRTRSRSLQISNAQGR